MKSLRAHGHAMLLVEQNLALAMSVADYLYVVSAGRFVFHGTPQSSAPRPTSSINTWASRGHACRGA